MKKLFTLFLFISCYISNAQVPFWTQPGSQHPSDPFTIYKYRPDENKDEDGTIWKLFKDRLLRIKNSDTSIFRGFPATRGSYQSLRSIYMNNNQFAFILRDDYQVGWDWNFTQHFGFYDGNTLRFFSQSDLNLFNKNYFSDPVNTQKYLWLQFDTQLIRFDKISSFKNFDNYLNGSTGTINNSKIFSFDTALVVITDRKLYRCTDSDSTFRNLVPDDSILFNRYDNTDKTLYLVSKTKLYRYRNNGIKSWDLPERGKLNELYNYEIIGGIFVLKYQNGIVILDSNVVSHTIFSEAGLESTSSSDDYRDLSNTRLDNKIVILNNKIVKGGNQCRNFFSYIDGIIKYEGTFNSPDRAFMYKKLSGEITYYYCIPNDTAKGILHIIKPGRDTTTLPMPDLLRHYGQIVADSQHIWTKRDSVENPWIPTYFMRSNQPMVKGKVFYDQNENSIQDAGEPGIDNYALKVMPLGLNIVPSPNGQFAFASETGKSYSLEISADSLFTYTSVLLPLKLSDTITNLIGIKLKNTKSEIKTSLQLPRSRCNSNGASEVRVENTGFLPIDNAIIRIAGDGSTQLSSVHSKSQSSDSLIFHIANLPARASVNFPYSVIWPGVEKIGQTAKFIYSAEKGKEEIPTDTTETEIRCSFDPNDKSVIPAGTEEEGYTLKTSRLTYTIRFENVGNDTAYTVTIYDTLSTNLDFSTLMIKESSHPVQSTVTEQGKVVFFFDKIMLPYSGINKEKSQGFVRFSIKPKVGLTDNTEITNQAGIVFDQNPPVITNKTLNTLVDKIPGTVLSTREYTSIIKNIYPNPSSGSIIISENADRIEVFRLTGEKALSTTDKQLNTKALQPGIYIFKGYKENNELLFWEKVYILH